MADMNIRPEILVNSALSRFATMFHMPDEGE